MKRALLTSLVLIAIIGILFAIYPRSRPVKGIPTPPTTIATQPFASIAIQPFASVSDGVVDSVESAIRAMYGFEVVVLEKVDLPDMAYTTIRFPRYRADSLLRWLVATKPDSVNIVIGLTDKDISTTKYRKGTDEIKEPEWLYRDFGIFGLGQIGGTACVVSSYRLHKDVPTEKFYTRLKRITCHEVGHVLGLKHCPAANCLMNDANESIRTIDRSTGALCGECRGQID